MEEADTISLEIEENSNNKILSTQLNQYNIYIDFNDYYKQLNPKPIRFDSNLSKNYLDEFYEQNYDRYQKSSLDNFDNEISSSNFLFLLIDFGLNGAVLVNP